MLINFQKLIMSARTQSSPETYLYFAFGSNMDPDQMIERVGPIEHYEPKTLRGYTLVFNKFSVNRQCGAANLLKTEQADDIVEGVMYTLSKSQMDALDICEGYRRQNGTLSRNPQGYKLEHLSLDGDIQAITYIADVTKGKGQAERIKRRFDIDLTPDLLKPSYEYVSRLVSAYDKGLISESYKDRLSTAPIQEAESFALYEAPHSSHCASI